MTQFYKINENFKRNKVVNKSPGTDVARYIPRTVEKNYRTNWRQETQPFYKRKRKLKFRLSQIWWGPLNRFKVYPYLHRRFRFGKEWSKNSTLFKFGPMNILKKNWIWEIIWPSIYRRHLYRLQFFNMLNKFRRDPLKYAWNLKIWKKTKQPYEKIFERVKEVVRVTDTKILRYILIRKKPRDSVKLKKWIRLQKPYYFSRTGKINYVNLFFKFKRKIGVFKSTVKRKASRFLKYRFEVGKKYAKMRLWYDIPQKGHKWRWRKILWKLDWRYKKMFKLKKKEYFLRLWKRHLKNKYRLQDKHLKYKSFAAHRNFFTNRLVQIINSTGGIKYFELGRQAVFGRRIFVEHKPVTDLNYVVKPFETIFLNLDPSYLRYRLNYRRLKGRRSKKRWVRHYYPKKFFSTGGFLHNTKCRTFMCWNPSIAKRTAPMQHLSNYYYYKLLSMWN